MKALPISLFALLSTMLILACVNPPDYPDTPVIKYLGVNKIQVNQDNRPLLAEDTLSIRFSFTDGDGDLSLNDTTDVFLYDSRFPSLANPYKIPTIPLDGTGNGIRGEITINILSSNRICCIENGFPCPSNPQNPVDTFSYEIQIRDRAGNLSNRIRTETIDIICR